MTDKKAVLVAGHICLDITPVFPSIQKGDPGGTLAPGKLVQVGRADIHTGGAVSNTGLALKKLGVKVRLAAKIGDDAFGQVVRGILDAHGSAGSLVTDRQSGTSYSVVLALPGVDRIFLHNPGANDTFCAADISDAMLDGIRHFHFGYPPLMRRMYENDGRELAELFQRVKARGITTSLDMAAVDPNSPAGQVDWARLLRNVLARADVFVPSAEELCFMLDRARYDEWNARANGGDVTRFLNVDADIKPLAGSLMEMGAKVVLIKCGAMGMYYCTSDTAGLRGLLGAHSLQEEGWGGRCGFEKSYFQPHVVSGTGAGDTSIAAFLAAMLNGCDIDKCVKLAAATGACCISAYDALSGLEPLDDLWGRIEKGWKKRDDVEGNNMSNVR